MNNNYSFFILGNANSYKSQERKRYSIILKLHIFEGKNEIEKEIILFTSKMCSVLSICQDALGRMWFSTEEGVCYYDGVKITVLKYLKTEDKSVSWHFYQFKISKSSYISSENYSLKVLIDDNNLYDISRHKKKFHKSHFASL